MQVKIVMDKSPYHPLLQTVIDLGKYFPLLRIADIDSKRLCTYSLVFTFPPFLNILRAKNVGIEANNTKLAHFEGDYEVCKRLKHLPTLKYFATYPRRKSVYYEPLRPITYNKGHNVDIVIVSNRKEVYGIDIKGKIESEIRQAIFKYMWIYLHCDHREVNKYHHYLYDKTKIKEIIEICDHYRKTLNLFPDI